MAPNDGLPTGQQPNDNARPDAGAAPAAPAAAPAPVSTPTDPDLAELAAARAAVEAEQSGAAAPPAQPTTETPPAPAAAPAAAPQGQDGPTPPPAPPAEVPTIPLPRFQQVNTERQRLAEENLYLKGVVDAMRTGQLPAAQGTPAAAAPPPPPSPAEQIQAKRQELNTLAEKFDAGEISFVEYEKQRGAIEDTIGDLRMQASRPQLQPPAPPAKSLADEAIEQDQIRQLEERHPFVRVLNQAQAHTLAEIAKVEAAGMGRPYGSSPRDTLALRAHVARLADVYGPMWGLKAPTPAPAPAAAPPTPAPNRALSPEAQARLAKHDMANGLPPDTAQFGSAASQDQITAASIEGMSDEAIMALPAATRARLFAQG